MTAKINYCVLSVLMVFLALCSITGCELNVGYQHYFYHVDEISTGFFSNLAPTISMNDWFFLVTRQSTYDSWTEMVNNRFYKDKKLSKPFTGSDLLYENTIIYCDFPIDGLGKKIGEITGTITLTNIPDPLTKIHLQNNYWRGSNWWSFNRKINISGISGASGSVKWSLPVFEAFIPDVESGFNLVIIPGDSLEPYEVSLPITKVITNSNENIGDLGTVNIGGVKLSGTINITLNGEPVPYLEILAQDDGSRLLNRTGLTSPQPGASWSLTYKGIGSEINIKFIIFIFNSSKEFLFDKYIDATVTVTNNQNISDINFDIGDISW